MGILKNLFKKREDRKPKNDYKDLFERLAEDNSKDLIWFLLGSLISADTLTSIESCKNSMTILEDLNEAIDRTSDKSYTSEEKREIQKYCNNGIEICKKDIEIFESGGYPELEPQPEPEPDFKVEIIPLDKNGNPIETKKENTEDVVIDEKNDDEYNT